MSFEILDERFEPLVKTTAELDQLYDGCRWAEGPAYFPAHRALVWSDIPNDRMLRYDEATGNVGEFRSPAGNTNGHTVDAQGRLVSCEHGNRRVTRTEHDGTITVLADSYEGKRLNSPNDVVVRSDGTIYFSDPDYGISGWYEGNKAEPELKEAVYRVDGKTAQVTKITDEVGGPNGLCFSPDYSKLYVADTGAPRDIKVFDVNGTTVRNGKRLAQLDIPGTGAPSVADGMRCDADGNIWAGARPGVQVIAPDGARIGMIRLPETCANVCFGGARRNRLFMTASQSLYAVYVETVGAHIA